MSSSRTLAVALIGMVLLFGGTACQSSTPDPQGGAVKTKSAQMPPLPDDKNAAKAVVRKMLMDEAIVLLKVSGLKHTGAQFDVPISFDDEDTQNGNLTMQFARCSDEQVEAMTTAIRANAWDDVGKDFGVNVRKGPLFLQWGKGYGGCRFKMTTINISQRLAITDDRDIVLELAAFKARP